MLIPLTFLAVISAPLFSFSPALPSDVQTEDRKSSGNITGQAITPAPAAPTVPVYFDPDDFEPVDEVRTDVILANRGTDPDPEDLLFGAIDETDIPDGASVPPDMTFEDDDTIIFVHYGTLNLRSLPTADSEIIHVFQLGDSMTRTGIGKEWSRVVDPEGREGYVFNELTGTALPTPTPTPAPTPVPKPRYTEPARANTLGEAIALEAQRYLGVRYRVGGSDPQNAFDCSGLTWYVYRRYGIETPRGTSSYWNAGTIIPYSQIEPGDVISWDAWNNGRLSHVGIYIGNGMMVHASSSNRAVVKVSVAQYSKYCRMIRVHRFYKN